MADFMEVIDDTLDDAGKTVKKLGKNKIFWFAVAGVGAVALIGYFLKSRNTSSGSTEVQYATGYTGYPITTGGSTEGEYAYTDSEVNQMLSDMQSSYEDVIGEYEDTISDMDSSFGEVIADYDSTIAAIERTNQETVNSMQSQLDKANATNADLLDEIETLTVENEALSNTYGSKTASGYDPDYKSNVNYQALINDAIVSGASGSTIDTLNELRDEKISVTGRSLEESNSSYDPNINYTELIGKAKSSGASQDVIDNLTAQRTAKIQGEYGGIDPDTGKAVSSGSTSGGSTKSKTGFGPHLFK